MEPAVKPKHYRVDIGFNIPDPKAEGQELRYDPGTDAKPTLVDPKSFEKTIFEDLVKAGAIVEITD